MQIYGCCSMVHVIEYIKLTSVILTLIYRFYYLRSNISYFNLNIQILLFEEEEYEKNSRYAGI